MIFTALKILSMFDKNVILVKATLGYGNLTEGYTFFCGGVIISENFILSAAHCAVSVPK